MIARGFFFSVRPPASADRVGRPKESVLPEPVRPRPRMSLPARASGMVAAWIGKGAVTPFCASLRTMPSGSPSEANVTVGSASSAEVASSEAASSEAASSVRSSAETSSATASPAASAVAVGAVSTGVSAATTASAISTTSWAPSTIASFSGMAVRSELEIDMRNAKPSGVSARARNSVIRNFDRLNAVQPRQGRVRATRRSSVSAPGNGSNDLLPYALSPTSRKPPSSRPGSHRRDLR